jgi:four helix bundle protein
MAFDIRERTKKFAVRVISLVKKLPKDVAGYKLGDQLIRSGTSIGANMEEADASPTRKDFFHKKSQLLIKKPERPAIGWNWS